VEEVILLGPNAVVDVSWFPAHIKGLLTGQLIK
jgi:hypothetical protein